MRFYLRCYLRIGASGLIGHQGPKLWESKGAAETPDTFPRTHDADGWWSVRQREAEARARGAGARARTGEASDMAELSAPRRGVVVC